MLRRLRYGKIRNVPVCHVTLSFVAAVAELQGAHSLGLVWWGGRGA